VHRPAGLFASHVTQGRDASAYRVGVARHNLASVDLPVSTHVRTENVVHGILLDRAALADAWLFVNYVADGFETEHSSVDALAVPGAVPRAPYSAA
jgi:hypothetical protein